jgi:hypothetical protein
MLIVPTRNRRAKYPEKLKGPLMPIIDPAFEKDALGLIMAVLLCGVIGFERQWRRDCGPTR